MTLSRWLFVTHELTKLCPTKAQTVKSFAPDRFRFSWYTMPLITNAHVEKDTVSLKHPIILSLAKCSGIDKAACTYEQMLPHSQAEFPMHDRQSCQERRALHTITRCAIPAKSVYSRRLVSRFFLAFLRRVLHTMSYLPLCGLSRPFTADFVPTTRGLDSHNRTIDHEIPNRPNFAGSPPPRRDLARCRNIPKFRDLETATLFTRHSRDAGRGVVRIIPQSRSQARVSLQILAGSLNSGTISIAN